ncbi:uncharacterized protein FA14DRAFT_132908 [Meira miltonrushii]|uniref:F-box domain-containing protein n=1 Tax=Meira miltonrushii TaxID=1280837 RepID=A0A316VBF8_9BASI|nr:uncharacterized protein FA14DRAFT_132908 [Meira miltonrushii]PWN34979.1 hypothetical protein FA14DRAFT_132908 [Meira miltonrushii]
MSSLLQNVLASRLAQATLGTDENGNIVVKDSQSQSQSQSIDDWEKVEGEEITSDDELVNVVSLPGTVPGTPHISRPPSPGGMTRSTPSKRSTLGKSIGTGIARKSKTDPLRTLPKEVSQRIFLSLPVSSLISLSQVNKRYRRSATLNYCWYRQCNKGTMVEEQADDLASGGAKWTRRASKMDWKTQYAKQRKMEAKEQQRLESLPGSGAVTPSRTQRLRDEGIKTASEQRQDEWREQEQQGYTKEEMRDWYKEQGGTKGGKLKGKRGKGGQKTGANDGSLWD